MQEACSTHIVNKKREQILAGKHQGKELTGRCSHRRNAVISKLLRYHLGCEVANWVRI